MRNMSFFHTQLQIHYRTKTVTRRRGWAFLKPGDRFRAIVKGQGLKKGEKVQVLAELECVSNAPEKLSAITERPYRDIGHESDREGFPMMSSHDFVKMFCKHMGGEASQIVNRIQFKYVEGK